MSVARQSFAKGRVMRRLLVTLIILAAIAAGVFFLVTQPRLLGAEALPNHTPNLENGARMFTAGGCASCHAAPASNKCGDLKYDKPKSLAGGRCLKTPFGTFNVPNISSDKTYGIGGWSDLDFVNAMVRGVSPGGEHYYPAFPYASYQRMRLEDLLDLKAFLDGLPGDTTPSRDHKLSFPFGIRRGLGLWKLLYLDGKPFTPDPTHSEQINRGAYLVQGAGHCGECHTPRNPIGGPDKARHLAGGPAPEGDGWIPNITPDETGLGDWSAADIVYALESGLTPEYDSFGGNMVAVQENMAKLAAEDREAIAAYLKSIPAVKHAKPKKQ